MKHGQYQIGWLAGRKKDPYSLPELEKVTGRLDFLKHVIRQRDSEEAAKFFDRLRKNIQ